MMATFNQVMDVLLKWPVLEIGDSESIDVGADVLAIGNGKLFGVAVSSGVISRTNTWIANPETGFAVNRSTCSQRLQNTGVGRVVKTTLNQQFPDTVR